jgi:hypothetical protein
MAQPRQTMCRVHQALQFYLEDITGLRVQFLRFHFAKNPCQRIIFLQIPPCACCLFFSFYKVLYVFQGRLIYS